MISLIYYSSTHPWYENVYLAFYLFNAAAGVLMTLALVGWHIWRNGDRRIPPWIVWVQAAGWIGLLVRTSQVLLEDPHRRPTGYLLAAVMLMNAGQAGHLWSLLRRRHMETMKAHEEWSKGGDGD